MEQAWPNGLRIVLYLIGLLWFFLGVSIIADIFMSAIEKVTSKKVNKIKNGKKVTFIVWNGTVANLTLMALGSSAPEILLAVIELLGAGMESGELGPSTIVGSAAFNLLCIIAVCVYVIPDGEYRQVKEVPVFAITASCSVFAYFWLVVILILSSPNIIDIWEGVLTFLYFPILVILAFMADKGMFSKKKQEDPNEVPFQNYSAEMSAARRREAIHFLTAGKRIQHMSSATMDEICIQFLAAMYEGRTAEDTEVTLLIERTGSTEEDVLVDYKTYTDEYGGLKEGQGYTPSQGEICIPAGETIYELKIPLIKGDEEATGHFICDLSNVRFKEDDESGAKPQLILGNQMQAQVTLVKGENAPGMLCFLNPDNEFPGPTEDFTLDVIVCRLNGTQGEVSCKYRTEQGTAMPELDYIETNGTLTFLPGQAQGRIEVKVLAKDAYECADFFKIYLEEIEGGAAFDPQADGGPDSAICTINILGGANENGFLSMLDRCINLDHISLGCKMWKESVAEAIYVNGSKEEQAEANAAQWAIHVFALPFKLFFLLVPPPAFFGGWLCFAVAISFVGLVTCFIGDMAALFGCCAGLPDSITAITFVALGTSLPDTFASMSAASAEPYADSSIGNVTGSNCVNVFLGLGLPWTIGSMYWSSAGATKDWLAKYAVEAVDYPNGAFVVRAGDLGFSVTAFIITCVFCIGTIVLRRVKLGGELGGDRPMKIATSSFFVMLWFYYIGLSSWKVLAPGASGGTQATAIAVATVIVVILGGGVLFASKSMAKKPADDKVELKNAGPVDKE
eukprot:TRINITY_DN2888_c0_g2_i1.p1 TRINITY_DN2888_c0_g2~~TRINITY_DN2888_c0_g2_i1.p1  ORF type:complete len:842 (+),score=232.82 TRINITY_DN2888_c0_g2_i1:149-2527(+)